MWNDCSNQKTKHQYNLETYRLAIYFTGLQNLKKLGNSKSTINCLWNKLAQTAKKMSCIWKIYRIDILF